MDARMFTLLSTMERSFSKAPTETPKASASHGGNNRCAPVWGRGRPASTQSALTAFFIFFFLPVATSDVCSVMPSMLNRSTKHHISLNLVGVNGNQSCSRYHRHVSKYYPINCCLFWLLHDSWALRSHERAGATTFRCARSMVWVCLAVHVCMDKHKMDAQP